MNTIKNPLILSKIDGPYYTVQGTKIGNQSGEYVDKALAEELLEALEIALWSELNGESEAQKQGKPRLTERIEIYKGLILKAKGQ